MGTSDLECLELRHDLVRQIESFAEDLKAHFWEKGSLWYWQIGSRGRGMSLIRDSSGVFKMFVDDEVGCNRLI